MTGNSQGEALLKIIKSSIENVDIIIPHIILNINDFHTEFEYSKSNIILKDIRDDSANYKNPIKINNCIPNWTKFVITDEKGEINLGKYTLLKIPALPAKVSEVEVKQLLNSLKRIEKVFLVLFNCISSFLNRIWFDLTIGSFPKLQ